VIVNKIVEFLLVKETGSLRVCHVTGSRGIEY